MFSVREQAGAGGIRNLVVCHTLYFANRGHKLHINLLFTSCSYLFDCSVPTRTKSAPPYSRPGLLRSRGMTGIAPGIIVLFLQVNAIWYGRGGIKIRFMCAAVHWKVYTTDWGQGGVLQRCFYGTFLSILKTCKRSVTPHTGTHCVCHNCENKPQHPPMINSWVLSGLGSWNAANLELG